MRETTSETVGSALKSLGTCKEMVGDNLVCMGWKIEVCRDPDRYYTINEVTKYLQALGFDIKLVGEVWAEAGGLLRGKMRHCAMGTVVVGDYLRNRMRSRW